MLLYWRNGMDVTHPKQAQIMCHVLPHNIHWGLSVKMMQIRTSMKKVSMPLEMRAVLTTRMIYAEYLNYCINGYKMQS